MLDKVFDAAGIEVRETTQEGEVTICCPFCAERGETPDTRFRLGINTKKGLAHCYNCKWASRDERKIVKELSRVFGVTVRLRYRPKEQEEKKTIELTPTGFPCEYERFTHGTDDPVARKAMTYLRSRKISLLQIAKHSIGYAAYGRMAWRVLFPVFGPRDKVYGCVGRAFGVAMTPKYLNTPNIKLLWNAHRVGRVAIVVEGVTDALRVERRMPMEMGAVPVARLGSTITRHQLEQLEQYKKIIILPDWDRAGVEGAIDLAARCEGMNVRIAVPHVMDGRDPGSLQFDVKEALETAVPWTKAVEHRLHLAAVRRGRRND